MVGLKGLRKRLDSALEQRIRCGKMDMQRQVAGKRGHSYYVNSFDLRFGQVGYLGNKRYSSDIYK